MLKENCRIISENFGVKRKIAEKNLELLKIFEEIQEKLQFKFE